MISRVFRPLSVAMFTMSIVGFAAPSTFAGFFVFVTPTGSTTSGGAVNAEVDITTGAGTINVTLKNLQANPTSVAQALSEVDFTADKGYTPGASPILTSSSGVLRTIASNKTYSDGGSASTGWLLSRSSRVFTLDDLNGGAGPAHLVIGAPNGSNLYSKANGSIAGNGPHNPFLGLSATFTITDVNVTSSTQIVASRFRFGTEEDDDFVTATPSTTVPEPAAALSTLTGLGLAGLAAWRRRRRSA